MKPTKADERIDWYEMYFSFLVAIFLFCQAKKADINDSEKRLIASAKVMEILLENPNNFSNPKDTKSEPIVKANIPLCIKDSIL